MRPVPLAWFFVPVLGRDNPIFNGAPTDTMNACIVPVWTRYTYFFREAATIQMTARSQRVDLVLHFGFLDGLETGASSFIICFRYSFWHPTFRAPSVV